MSRDLRERASPDPRRPGLQERREVALAFDEGRERSADLFRREHRLRMMPGHGQILISEHAVGVARSSNVR